MQVNGWAIGFAHGAEAFRGYVADDVAYMYQNKKAEKY